MWGVYASVVGVVEEEGCDEGGGAGGRSGRCGAQADVTRVDGLVLRVHRQRVSDGPTSQRRRNNARHCCPHSLARWQHALRTAVDLQLKNHKKYYLFFISQG